MITRVTNALPVEKRKAYLFRPQTMLTMDTMRDRILEADGITKDMIQAQQKRLNLLQRLLSATPEAMPEVIQQEEELIDQDFFNILARIIEATMAQGDQQTARQLALMQQEILKHSSYGKEIQAQAEDAELAVKSLQEAGKNGLTREKLLDLLAAAPNDNHISTIVGLARAGLDYTFFQILGQRIEAASGDEQQKLTVLRDKLLQLVKDIDEAVQQQVAENRNFLEAVLKAPNIEEILTQNMEAVSDLFVQIVQAEYDQARQKNDPDRLAKLQQVINVLQKLSAPPPEIAFIEELISVGDEASRRKLLEANADKIDDNFIQIITSLAAQSEQQGQSPEVSEALRDISRLVLKFSMEKNFRK